MDYIQFSLEHPRHTDGRHKGCLGVLGKINAACNLFYAHESLQILKLVRKANFGYFSISEIYTIRVGKSNYSHAQFTFRPIFLRACSTYNIA
jgi:regulatory protein YycI of two-component signal transduction system YycFG